MKALTVPGRPTLSVRLLLPVRRALQAAGHDTAGFFAKYALVEELETPSARIDHDLTLRVLDDAVALAGDPSFLLAAAELVHQGDTDAFGYAARACRTGGEAMERCARYARLRGSSATFSSRRSERVSSRVVG